jgi:LAS superfamily LD-carboxypeptidase LdcB
MRELDFSYGDLNPLPDATLSSISRSRTDPIQEVNQFLTGLYTKNYLKNVDEFYGVVVHQLQRTNPSADYPSSQIISDGDENKAAAPYLAYKVYIPELECRPFPESYDDPVIATYRDIYASLGLIMAIGPGSIVIVKFGDFANMSKPLIIGAEGAIDGGLMPAVRSDLRGTFGAGNSQILSSGPTSGENKTGKPYTAADPGTMSWSNRAKQYTVTWQSTKWPQWNGQVIKNGEIGEIAGFFETVNQARLIKPAADDFRRLAAAFKVKFGYPLHGSGYRTYGGQVGARMIRVSGDDHGCKISANSEKFRGEGASGYQWANGKCYFVGVAAIPGRSNHGWGAAIDLSGKKSGMAAGLGKEKRGVFRKKSSEEFRWVNKYAGEYNFVFGVRTEHWHLNWIPFSNNTKNWSPGMRKIGTTSWVGGAANDPITKV